MITVEFMTGGESRSRDKKAEELIEQLSFGNMSAMGELYELIKKDVFAYALSKTANRDDAEDVTHSTFVQIWKYAAQYKPMGKPLAWIFTIEINIIRRQLNKSKRITSLEELSEQSFPENDTAENIINHEFLCQLLETLGEEEREIISLHVISGLKHREIATLMGKPLSTVLSKYNRAINKLKAQAMK